MPDLDAQRRRPLTLFLGLAILIAAELLLIADMRMTGRGVVARDTPAAELATPETAIAQVARWTARHMTPIAWTGYLLFAEGVLTMLAWRRGERRGSCVRRRPWLFLVAYLTSVPVWCFFDWVNFYYIRAWYYHGLPDQRLDRYVGYFLSFAAISPGMFFAAQFFQRLGLRRLTVDTPGRRRRIAWAVTLGVVGLCVVPVLLLMMSRNSGAMQWRGGLPGTTLLLVLPGAIIGVVSRRIMLTAFALGVGFVAWPFVVQKPIAAMTLWTSLILLLDPINAWCGRPSIIRDWREGRWGRTVALMAGGAVSGLLWECWNYWAVAKWTYDLPFLGPLETYRYFEMPLVGFLGFLPFGVECWVALQTILIFLPGLTEPLPTEHDVL